ncbi:MAG: hypothetical protein M3375_01545 [Actinomycetota bacterium]|nr:hypothetical protein [Actinomycetota bacterium]
MAAERRPTLGLAPALPGILLVVIIAWALAAVMMLTGTLTNAREIDKTLPLINSQVNPIDKDLDSVRLAARTGRLTTRIDRAAKPLSAQADRILSVAASIDGRVAGILGTAVSINETARSINGTVRSINSKVSAIHDSVISINNTVDSIHGNVLTINGTVSSIEGKVSTIGARVRAVFRSVGPVGATDRSIKGSVSRILRTFRRLEPETRSIDRGVAAINRRADRGVEGVRGLKSDFGPIRVLVGSPLPSHGTGGPGNIHGHANSIDCARLIRGPYCGQ